MAKKRKVESDDEGKRGVKKSPKKKVTNRSKYDNKAAQRRKEKSQKTKKKYRFLGIRMWWSTFLSKLFADRDYIAKDIGNNVYVGNNIVTTKRCKTALILITDLGDHAPKFFPSIIASKLKREFECVQLDPILKNKPFNPKQDRGLEDRVKLWTKTLQDNTKSERYISRAQRCLYTATLAKDGVQLYKTRMYLRLNVGKNDAVDNVVKSTVKALKRMGIESTPIRSKMDVHMKYTTMMSNVEPKDLRNIPYIITTDQVLAELMPNAQGLNDDRGTIIATDIINNNPYYVNFRANPGAKNIGIFAESGGGKTHLGLNIAQECYIDEYRECIEDIKGNEFVEHTKACGGTVINLGPKSRVYVNTFVWDKNTNKDAQEYASAMFTISKRKLCILAQCKPEDYSKSDILIDGFLQDVYHQCGAIMSNKNTWYRTESLTPQKIYLLFKKYLSLQMRTKYGEIAETAYNNIGKYFSSGGSVGHAFTRPINYAEVLDTPVLTFAFDMLDDVEGQDVALYEVKRLDMRIIKDDYIINNKKKALWTLDIEEEASIAPDFAIQEYTRSFLLRRAQNVVNVLIANSVQTLTSNKLAKGIIDNFTMLIVGNLNTTSQKYISEEYSLSKQNRDYIKRITDKSQYDKVFVVINKLQARPVDTLIKVYSTPEAVKSKIFKGVDVEDDEYEEEFV